MRALYQSSWRLKSLERLQRPHKRCSSWSEGSGSDTRTDNAKGNSFLSIIHKCKILCVEDIKKNNVHTFTRRRSHRTEQYEHWSSFQVVADSDSWSDSSDTSEFEFSFPDKSSAPYTRRPGKVCCNDDSCKIRSPPQVDAGTLRTQTRRVLRNLLVCINRNHPKWTCRFWPTELKCQILPVENIQNWNGWNLPVENIKNILPISRPLLPFIVKQHLQNILCEYGHFVSLRVFKRETASWKHFVSLRVFTCVEALIYALGVLYAYKPPFSVWVFSTCIDLLFRFWFFYMCINLLLRFPLLMFVFVDFWVFSV